MKQTLLKSVEASIKLKFNQTLKINQRPQGHEPARGVTVKGQGQKVKVKGQGQKVKVKVKGQPEFFVYSIMTS